MRIEVVDKLRVVELFLVHEAYMSQHIDTSSQGDCGGRLMCNRTAIRVASFNKHNN